MITCSNCGAENTSGQKFCGECGTALAATCSSCGAVNAPGQKFCGECGTPLAGDVAHAPSVAVERRLVSVLFADLVGFTPLSEDARPRGGARAPARATSRSRAQVIERYGGTVEKFIGDAVMAVWGTPDGAGGRRRARRPRRRSSWSAPSAALGGELGHRRASRCGPASSPGRPPSPSAPPGQGMVAGDLVNTAVPCPVAPPSRARCSSATRRAGATEAAIAYADAGHHELKGKSGADAALARASASPPGAAGGAASRKAWSRRSSDATASCGSLKELFHASAEERKAHLRARSSAIAGHRQVAARRGSSTSTSTASRRDVVWHRGRCLAYGEGVDVLGPRARWFACARASPRGRAMKRRGRSSTPS